ncbi:MAG: glucose-6-phosphate dehydrogenase, partial [Chitinivibrionales bacterium]
ILYYHRGISGLKTYINRITTDHQVYFFLAIPPKTYADTAAEISREGFPKDTTLIIEKPFGYDYISANNLDSELVKYFNEESIYRIDHYLAKEAVQNIMIFRFANTVFGPVWNNRYIEEIQINASETMGVQNRAAYFDSAGIIRDMIQNHLTQLLCLITMEPPVSLDPDDIRAQKIDILKALNVLECRGLQYKGYTEERGVDKDSATPTYAELKLGINNFRWYGVPVYIRAGKALDRDGTEICVKFRSLPPLLFNSEGEVNSNRIVFAIQPAPGIILDISGKVPGGELKISENNLAFCYRNTYKGEIPEAYQRLLLDALRCDRTLFVSAEETETAWKRYSSILDKEPEGVYEKGSDPAGLVYKDWTDFKKYQTNCSNRG